MAFATTRSQSNHGQPVPSWLESLLADTSPPPRMYAWRVDNLPGGSGRYCTSHHASSPSPASSIASSGSRRRRIYVLGAGNIGRLLATSLSLSRPVALEPPPDVTLVVRRRAALEAWAVDPCVRITRANGEDVVFGPDSVDGDGGGSGGKVDVELWTDEPPPAGPLRTPGSSDSIDDYGNGIIENLIVATKAAAAVPAVDRLRRHLGPGSTVAFAHNGIPIVWPPLGFLYVSQRWPNGGGPGAWLAVVTTHGVFSLPRGEFTSRHASVGELTVGGVLVGSDSTSDAVEAARGQGKEVTDDEPQLRAGLGVGTYLGQSLATAPWLNGSIVPRTALFAAQLGKLVVNCVINPLTAVLRCRNGELFQEEQDGDRRDDRSRDGRVMVAAVIDVLLHEATEVLRAYLQSEEVNRGVLAADTAYDQEAVLSTLLQRFDFKSLRRMLYDVGHKVRENRSSMLQDVEAGRETEIRELNGWLVDMAAMLGRDTINVSAHRKLIELVLNKTVLQKEELARVLNP